MLFAVIDSFQDHKQRHKTATSETCSQIVEHGT